MIERFYSQFPELYREGKAGTSKFRFSTGAIAVFALSFLIYMIEFKADTFGFSTEHATERYLQLTGGFQIFVLAFFGLSQAIRSIVDEKIQKTWDFQRLTPLGSRRMVIGKILASFIFPGFLFVCFLPGQIVALSQNSALLPGFLATLGQYLMAAYAAIAIGVMISAYSERNQRGSLFIVFITAYMIIPNLVLQRESRGPAYDVHFMFWSMSRLGWLTLTSFLLGVWATLGAQWRVGRDFLEGSKFWRIPAFVAFIYAYAAATGFKNQSGDFESDVVTRISIISIVVPAIVYLIALADAAPRSRIKALFNAQKPLHERLNLLPTWVTGSATTIVATLLVYLLTTLLPAQNNGDFFKYVALMPLFLLRDCLVFQLFVWLRVRSAATFSMFIAALLYVIPGLLLRSAFNIGLEGPGSQWLSTFLPVIPEGGSVPLAFLPILLQIGFLGFLLFLQFGKQSAPGIAKEI